MRWRVHCVSARELVSQPVSVRATEIWGWTGEGGWNLRNRRTLSTSSKHALVPETRSECQEAQQIRAGSLCQKLKKLIKRKLLSHFLNNKRKLYLPSPTTYGTGGSCFTILKSRKAKAFYAYIIWKALLIFSRKTQFRWIPADTGAWGCSCPRYGTLYFPLLNYMSFLSAHLWSTHFDQPVNRHPTSAMVWLCIHTEHRIWEADLISLCKILLLSLPSFLQPVLKQ